MNKHLQRIARFLFWLLIAVIFFVTIGHFPPLEQLTRAQSAALGILLIAALLWITEMIPLFVTSLLVLFLAIAWLTPLLPDEAPAISSDLFLSPFFSDIIVLFLGGFVLSAALRKQRLDEWLGRWILARSGSSLSMLTLGVMSVTAFLSMWLSNTATAAMMLTIVVPIAERLDPKSAWRKGLILAVPLASNIGGIGTPIGSPPNAIALKYMASEGIVPSFSSWMLIGVPGVVALLGLAWLVLRILCGKPPTYQQAPTPESVLMKSLSEKGSDPLRHGPKTNKIDLPPKGQTPFRIGSKSKSLIIVLAALVVTIVGWMTAGLHGYSTGTVALLPILILFGSGVLTTKELRSLPWDVLILMGGGLCLGVVLDASGLALWLVDSLPVAGLSSYQLMIVFGATALLLSSVMSNTAAANLVMPVVLGLSVEPLEPMFLSAAFACSVAMPLPVSTPPNAIAFAAGTLSVSDMVRAGGTVTILGAILTFTIGYWWWDFVGFF